MHLLFLSQAGPGLPVMLARRNRAGGMDWMMYVCTLQDVLLALAGLWMGGLCMGWTDGRMDGWMK